jgi:hypothetical protein
MFRRKALHWCLLYASNSIVALVDPIAVEREEGRGKREEVRGKFSYM